MAFHNFFADRKANPGPGILISPMQALENDKNAFKVLRLNPDAIIPDRKEPYIWLRQLGVWGRIRHPLSADFYPRRLLAAELHGVTEQILKELRQLRRIGYHSG